MKKRLSFLLLSLTLSLGQSAAFANDDEPLPAVTQFIDKLAKKFSQCKIEGGDLKQFPTEAAIPGANEWLGHTELAPEHVGKDVYEHTLVVHAASGSVFIISTAGPVIAGNVRGPIPWDYDCKAANASKKRNKAAAKRAN